MIGVKDLLIIGVAIAIAAWLLIPTRLFRCHTPPPANTATRRAMARVRRPVPAIIPGSRRTTRSASAAASRTGITTEVATSTTTGGDHGLPQ
jgi:hypothetical protein